MRICRYLTNEWRVAKDRLAELTEEIAAESVKKNQFATTLQEKVRIGDRFDENLRKYAQKIKELESVEYPGENEREMLVSFCFLCRELLRSG